MKRCDGKRLKSLGPFVKMIPYIMEKRSDAQIFSKQIICTDKIDKYIAEKWEQGYKISYMHLFIAIYCRMIAERPQLNRFIMNNQIYSRNGIFISMAVKRSLKDDGEETTVKFQFTGHENIFEITDIINKSINEAMKPEKLAGSDKIASDIMSMPGTIKKIMVRIIKSMDHYNLLPKRIIDASPFHTSLFFTYLKSIKINYIYHHIYDFGTTGIFVALGKTEKMPIVENDEIVIRKCCEVGYTLDERICDGLYFANSLKVVMKYLNDPYLLENKIVVLAEDAE